VVAAVAPNRKLAAARHAALEARLVPPEQLTPHLRVHLAFVWTYYLRFFALAGKRPRRRLVRRVRVLGEEHLHAATKDGGGAILLSVHLGDFDLAGAWIAARHGLTLVVVANLLRPRWREALFTFTRHRCGIVMRDLAKTQLADLEEDLRAGRAVLVMLDRQARGPASRIVLLGRPATAPLSVSVLAARTGAPLLPAATWRGRRGETVAWFGSPIPARNAGQAAQAVADSAGTLGRVIREHPEQWHVPADLAQLAWEKEGTAFRLAPTKPAGEAGVGRMSA
jgi:KDO2-lipid IV(A) lauroyltransferase